MTCTERDQNLLLLAHNALPLGQRLKTLWHVSQCARCRVRLNELEMVSRVLAATINPRAGQGGYAQGAIAQGAQPIFSVSAILLTVLVIAVVLGVTATVAHKIAADRAQTLSLRHHHTLPQGCAPNLPNDQCR